MLLNTIYYWGYTTYCYYECIFRPLSFIENGGQWLFHCVAPQYTIKKKTTRYEYLNQNSGKKTTPQKKPEKYIPLFG